VLHGGEVGAEGDAADLGERRLHRAGGGGGDSGISAAVMRWPSVWPSGISRTPAETMFAAKACSQSVASGPSGRPSRAAARPTATG
jgi:hypothetical protein